MSGKTVADRLSECNDDIIAVAGARDREGFVKATVGLLAHALTGVPVIGVLAGEAAAKAFAMSAWGQMEQALKDLDAEAAEEVRVRRIVTELEARIVAAGKVLLDHPGAQTRSDFGESLARAAASADVLVERIEVLERAMGVEVSADGKRHLAVGLIVVRPGGTGVRI